MVREDGAGAREDDLPWARRRPWLVVAALGVVVLAHVLVARDESVERAVAPWREVGATALLLVGIPTLVVGVVRLVRAGRLGQPLRTPLGSLPRAERTQARQRLVSTTLTPGQVNATRRVAAAAVARRTGLVAQVGLGIGAGGLALGATNVVTVLLGTAAAVWMAAEVPAALRDGRSAERFLAAHPPE